MDIESLPSAVQKFDASKFSNVTTIGYGGEGIVLKATYGYYGDVAFKEHRRLANNNRFNKREIEALLKHSFHPNIIRLLGFAERMIGKERKITGVVMELMENGSLHDVIHNAEIKYGMGSICSWMTQAGQALCYLHNGNVVHRDVKPSNLLLSDNYRKLKVTDFGMTRKLSESTALTADIGTGHYMPPEMVRNDNGKNAYTNKIDVYSFAITIWETVARKAPYQPTFSHSKVLEGERPLLSEIKSKRITNLLRESWSQNPTNRPTMEQVVDFFQKYPVEDRCSDGIDVQMESSTELTKRISECVTEAKSSRNFEKLFGDMERILEVQSSTDSSATPNITNWRRENAKKTVPLDGKQLEALFTESCDQLLFEMEKCNEDMDSDGDSEMLFERLEQLRTKYEPAVPELKSRFLAESTNYSTMKPLVHELKLASLEEQLREFRVTIAGWSKNRADGILREVIFHCGRIISNEEGSTDVKRICIFFSGLAKEVAPLVSKKNENAVEEWKMLAAIGDNFGQIFAFAENVDQFLDCLKTETFFDSQDDINEESSLQQKVLGWPKRRDELTNWMEEIQSWRAENKDIPASFYYDYMDDLTIRFPDSKKLAARKQFLLLVRKNNIYHKVIVEKLGKPPTPIDGEQLEIERNRDTDPL